MALNPLRRSTLRRAALPSMNCLRQRDGNGGRPIWMEL